MRVLIRADASTQIGTGHVLRCMALGQALIDAGDEVRLHACDLPDGLAERVGKEGIGVSTAAVERGSSRDLDSTLIAAKDWADVIVLDGYCFDRNFQVSCGTDYSTMVMDDDRPKEEFVADILFNQNLHAKPEAYEHAQVGKMLFGPKYALLRREFREQPKREASVKTRNVLVTLGGSDPANVTKRVIEGLKHLTLRDVHARVLVGSSNPHWFSLKSAADAEGTAVELLENVTDMREQYEWADIAIAAGGSTAWELAFMGLPALLIILVDNQEKIAKSVWRAGVAHLLDWYQKVSPEQIAREARDLLVSSEERDRMGQWGQELVDGQGALRVVAALRDLVA